MNNSIIAFYASEVIEFITEVCLGCSGCHSTGIMEIELGIILLSRESRKRLGLCDQN